MRVVCVGAGGAEHVHLGEHHPGELGLLPHHQGADGRRHSQGAREGTGKNKSRVQLIYTAKTKYRNFETNIPRKGISGSQSQFPHSCVCEWFIYSHDRSAYSSGGNILGREYINRSQRHECGNWGWVRAIPRKGIHKWDFRCSVIIGKCDSISHKVRI